jgi:hypothetical protein
MAYIIQNGSDYVKLAIKYGDEDGNDSRQRIP